MQTNMQISELWQRTRADLTNPVFIKQMAWVIGFWGVVLVTILLNIDYLQTAYPNPVRPDDRLLDLFAENTDFIIIGEVFSAMQVFIVVLLVWSRNFRDAPRLLFLTGVMFMMRGFIITLTPLAQIQPPSLNYDESHIIAQNFYHGMFFSGHTASAFIQAMYFKGHRLRPVLLSLASIQAFTLILSHSHYTIDIVGGLFVAYFIVKFDWMRLVPSALREVRWMPWYVPYEMRHENEPLPVHVMRR